MVFTQETELRSWKKVFVSDLIYIVNELKETIDKPAVIILSGEVGAGKTTFSQAYVPDGLVQSPTYSLISETSSAVVADLYRLKDAEEFTHLELGLYAENKEVLLVEWGRPYLAAIANELGTQFHYYEMLIELNPLKEGQEEPSRNYYLRELSG